MKRISVAGLSLLVLLAAGGAGSAPVHAATLTDYYKTLTAVRKCELTVDDESVARLQAAIENKVTSVDASSDTINSVFDELAAEIGPDMPTFCAEFGDQALEILSQL